LRNFYIVTVITLLLLIAAMAWLNNDPDAPFLPLVMMLGALGALVREHIHIRQLMRAEDPHLEKHLKVVVFSPVTGGLLALIGGALVASGLIEGDLFPRFTGMGDAFADTQTAFQGIGLETNRDLLKLVVWSILAGFSERFVVGQMRRLTAGLGGDGKAPDDARG
jgi:hypothetical protein